MGLHPDPNLIGQKSTDPRQNRHINKRKHRPTPTVGLATNHHQRSHTLRAKCKENHDRQGHRNGKHRRSIRPRRGHQGSSQTFVLFTHVTSETVNCPECRDHNFSCRKRRQNADTNAPVPAQWLKDRLDGLTDPPQPIMMRSFEIWRCKRMVSVSTSFSHQESRA